MNIHKISEHLAIEDSAASGAGLAALSRAAGTYTSAGVDATICKGPVQYFISAGTVGGTLDAKLQESDDNSTFTDNPNVSAITQLVAAGKSVLEFNIRKLTKRYFRISSTVGTATAVYGVTAVYQKRLPNG
jgi:hypothetical protein